MKRKLIIATAFTFAVLGGIGYFWLQSAEESFQRDADIARLRHLEHYGTLIEEFRRKTGKVPLQGRSDLPTYVLIANDQQQQYARHPPITHYYVPTSDFIAELESGLGRAVDEYYDPQFRPYRKPNFYIYMVKADTYFFAIHVHQHFSFARKLGAAHHKIEISNAPNAQNQAIDPDKLFRADEFSAARDLRIKKRLFKIRDDQYLHFTKQK